jgi:hypothetical protein
MKVEWHVNERVSHTDRLDEGAHTLQVGFRRNAHARFGHERSTRRRTIAATMVRTAVGGCF